MSYGVSVTLSFLGGYTFPQKKGIALAIAVLHFSYFFHGDGLKPRKPSRQGSSRGSPAVSLESVTLDLRKSRNVPRRCFRFSVSQPREASKRTDRTGVSRREASAGSSRARVRKRRRERPARVASRPRAARVPGGAPHERGDGSRDRFIIASSANDDGCVETRDARLFAGVSWYRMTTRVGVFRTRTRVRVRRVFVRWRLNFRDASFAVASASTLFDKRQKPKASSTSPASSFPAARAR